jgi:hypothetical protein
MTTSGPAPRSSLVLYESTDGRTRVECRFQEETIWLTQAQMAELFQTTPQNITLHLKAIYAEGEQQETATCKAYLQVRQEGLRQVSRELQHYMGALDAHTAMSTQALNSPHIQAGLKDILLHHAGLWEALRQHGDHPR